MDRTTGSEKLQNLADVVACAGPGVYDRSDMRLSAQSGSNCGRGCIALRSVFSRDRQRQQQQTSHYYSITTNNIDNQRFGCREFIINNSSSAKHVFINNMQRSSNYHHLCLLWNSELRCCCNDKCNKSCRMYAASSC